MIKILFVTFNGIGNESFGGAKASYSNYINLSTIGAVIPYEIKKISNIWSIISLIQGNVPPCLNKDIIRINSIIEDEKIDVVFFDSSLMGNAVERCLCKNTVVFCHNYEKKWIDVRFGKKFSFKKLIYSRIIFRNEKVAVSSAKCVCTLTNRDAESINKEYGRKIDVVVPISMMDVFVENGRKESKESDPICLLFGPAQRVNINAYRWFCENVSPYIHCRTLIAGRGMERLAYLKSEKIDVIGFVESISELYEKALFVAIPLFEGGGMKIKTAEALMFGKYIFGTSEAFVGYDIDFAEVGGLCNSAEEFIRKINDFIDSKINNNFCKYARNLFVEKYSNNAALEGIKTSIDISMR